MTNPEAGGEVARVASAGGAPPRAETPGAAGTNYPEDGGEVFAVRVYPHDDPGAAVHEEGGRYGEQGRARGGEALLGAPAQVYGGSRSKSQVPCESSICCPPSVSQKGPFFLSFLVPILFLCFASTSLGIVGSSSSDLSSIFFFFSHLSVARVDACIVVLSKM